MEPILSMSRNNIYAPSSVKPKEAAPVKEPEKEPEKKSEQKPPNALQDTYSPEKPPEASGRYWMEPDETGQSKIHFDDPEKKSPDKPNKADEPNKPDKKSKTESCTGDTSKVDREIERLKKQRETLSQRLNMETNETKIKELERELQQVKAELQKKDNDTYRRQHTVFS